MTNNNKNDCGSRIKLRIPAHKITSELKEKLYKMVTTNVNNTNAVNNIHVNNDDDSNNNNNNNNSYNINSDAIDDDDNNNNNNYNHVNSDINSNNENGNNNNCGRNSGNNDQMNNLSIREQFLRDQPTVRKEVVGDEEMIVITLENENDKKGKIYYI